jgi:predicted amidohydrolase
MRAHGLPLFVLLVAVATGSLAQTPADKTAGITVRVAAVSFVPQKFDLAGNADRLERAFRLAHQGKAQIAVGPEGALDGYVVNEIIAGKAIADQIKQVAIAIDDPVIKRFQRLARELEMCLVFGFAERIRQDVFNCAVFIDQRGKIRGTYHKMQFAEGYDADWWFNRLGTSSRAFDTPYGRCGILICNDRWNPQLARIPVLDGARFLIIPAFGSRSESQDKAVLSRGKENSVPVIEANVGVTLVVDDGTITAVDRHEEGVTFGQITIPPAIRKQPRQRDQLEEEFLAWRGAEMQRRLQRTLQRLKEDQAKAIAALKKLGARIRLDDDGQPIEVNLQETATGNDGLAHLAGLTSVREISLHQTKVTDAGLVHVKGLVNLERLFLSDTQTADDGLVHLAGLQKLKVLGLSGTRVSDKGLMHLEKLKQLESLFLIHAPVTDAGVEKLQRALPKCDIVH